MNKVELLNLLNGVSRGSTSVDEALEKLKIEPYSDLDFAKIDNHRALRHGIPEVIYGEGKTKEQILKIVSSMIENGEKTILVTRISQEKVDFILSNENVDGTYDKLSRVLLIGENQELTGKGKILVVCAGTSDLYCAKEAEITARAFGNDVELLCDVGVAGIHRLIDNVAKICDARAIIAIAGMEGALASVVGGIANCPVIAVPTSVGYGANFGGISALLAMLNSCASNVSVVNIDNGFSAAYIASIINHLD